MLPPPLLFLLLLLSIGTWERRRGKKGDFCESLNREGEGRKEKESREGRGKVAYSISSGIIKLDEYKGERESA